jgi:hypothetical protein
MIENCEWLNFRWGLDVSYVTQESAPLLTQLCKKHKRFWDGKYFYMLQSNVVLRWPDWRKNYRVDMEKVRVRHHQSHKQTKLTAVLILPAKEAIK